ncbi:RNA polymerase sigma factor [Sphingopyxis sp. 113P3]|uniref:RNA polymerase sigma factor n=1 Tax=Sphingopyxis sp. (strain 113P3) TaxID=292913 RepID=UPI0006AD528F|nr:RNA polymerase sigma factor [Sphingopyxis sp. 113P3]ALC10569.1 hypothetical protein LH20_01240 [Sphingopyxis sp. 113P3]
MGLTSSELTAQRTDLLRYIGRQVSDSAVREDIVQEAYLRLLTYEARPENTVMNAQALLRRISLNLVRNHFRHASRHATIELSDQIPCNKPCIHKQLEERELVRIVLGVLKGMPPLRREVFVRRRGHGESARDVAEALGLSPGAVDAHVARAMVDLNMAIEKIERRGGPVRG